MQKTQQKNKTSKTYDDGLVLEKRILSASSAKSDDVEPRYPLGVVNEVYQRALRYQAYEQAREQAAGQREIVEMTLKNASQNNEDIALSTLYEVGQNTLGLSRSCLERAINATQIPGQDLQAILDRNGIDSSVIKEKKLGARINYFHNGFRDYVKEKVLSLLEQEFSSEDLFAKSTNRPNFEESIGLYFIPFLGQMMFFGTLLDKTDRKKETHFYAFKELNGKRKKVKLATMLFNAYTNNSNYNESLEVNISIYDPSFVAIYDELKKEIQTKAFKDRTENRLSESPSINSSYVGKS